MNCSELSAREYLSQAYRIDQRINSKLEQVQSLRDLSTKATATLCDTPRGGTLNIYRMESIIAKITDLESEINYDLNTLIDLKREIVTVVRCVENPELQTLLELRYLCYKTWEEISVNLHLDVRWIHRLHGRALNEVDAIRHY